MYSDWPASESAWVWDDGHRTAISHPGGGLVGREGAYVVEGHGGAAFWQGVGGGGDADPGECHRRLNLIFLRVPNNPTRSSFQRSLKQALLYSSSYARGAPSSSVVPSFAVLPPNM